MNIIRIVLIAALFASPLFAEKFPSQVKKSVTFIFAKDTSNRLGVQGTGFFVLLKTQQETDTATFGYLVTTKKALKKPDGKFLDTIYVRINRKDGYSDTLIVQLTINGVPRYFLHPDSTVDLAIIPAFPDANRYDVLYIPTGIIGSFDFFSRENIAEGNELFYIGMLQSHIGIFKNIPAVRYGRIAQMSQEKYQWDGTYTEFFLLETDNMQGSAGSPVYYFTEAARDSGGAIHPSKLVLCGILAGSFNQGKTADRLSRVIPSAKLNELLNLVQVSGERDKEFTRLRQEKKK